LFIIILIPPLGLNFDNVWIEQKAVIHSRIDCTYRVKTYVWYRGSFLSAPSIEKSAYEYNVKWEDAETIKKEQLAELLPYKIKLEEALKNYKCGE